MVQKRIADLLLDLDDGSILHIDFQNRNDRWMAHREGIYGIMVCPTSTGAMTLNRSCSIWEQRSRACRCPLQIGRIRIAERLIDIREYDAAELLATGNPGGYALALLARNGIDKIREIVRKANRLRGARRQRVLTQMAVGWCARRGRSPGIAARPG